jgi:ADP-ribosylglycohydrolase
VDPSRHLGTILGLAIGDALGAPVEFFTIDEITKRYGSDGIGDLEPWAGFSAGTYTDDTQMSLATANGLIDARTRFEHRDPQFVVEVVLEWYLKWLESQDDPRERRAPGQTCMDALRSGIPVGRSKGCGGVMRTAPVGLAYPPALAFRVGMECAALTHGHPSGYLSAGYLSALVARLVCGGDLHEAATETREDLSRHDGCEETLESVDLALALAASPADHLQAIERLGQGWVGEQALAIALFCALKYERDWSAATLAAVNHSGDSDSTGSICGAILGARLGVSAIPTRWIDRIENQAQLSKTARDLLSTG